MPIMVAVAGVFGHEAAKRACQLEYVRVRVRVQAQLAAVRARCK
jgi:hypothetical protein